MDTLKADIEFALSALGVHAEADDDSVYIEGIADSLMKIIEGYFPVEYAFKDYPHTVHEARIEYYRHLDDVAYGRWRSKKFPDVVFYAEVQQEGTLINLRTGTTALTGVAGSMHSDDPELVGAWEEYRTDRAPWNYAKPGEVWDMVTDNGSMRVLIGVEGEFLGMDKRIISRNTIRSATRVLGSS